MLEELFKFIAQVVLIYAFAGLFRPAATPKILWIKVVVWLCAFTSITAFVVSAWIQNQQFFDTAIVVGFLGILGALILGFVASVLPGSRERPREPGI